MTEWVVNASPLILLSRIGLLPVLPDTLPHFLIPLGVAEEIQAGPTGNPAAIWLESLPEARFVPVPAINATVAGWDLGKGESQVLSWAYEHRESGVVLDDNAARRCANALDIPCMGVIGLLIRAKRAHHVASLSAILEMLPGAGFHIASSLCAEAKRLVGE